MYFVRTVTLLVVLLSIATVAAFEIDRSRRERVQAEKRAVATARKAEKKARDEAAKLSKKPVRLPSLARKSK